MQTTDRIWDITKFFQSISNSASTYSNAKIYQVPIINSRDKIFFSRFSSFIMGSLTLTSWHLEEKWACLIKESKYFSFKEKWHIPYDCFKKKKIAAITKYVSENNNSEKKE